MSKLSQLGIKDLRPRLSVKNVPESRRQRRGNVTSATLHYNGPAVGAFGNPQAELRHIIEVDVSNHQVRIGADSLAYHLTVLSDGSIYQTRDYELQAWHCGNSEGNEHSLAIHLPLGGLQDATPAQWEATSQLFEAIIIDYGLAGRQAIKGHLEWSATACPGPLLMHRLNNWRDQPGLPAGGPFRVKPDIAAANVRQGPGTNYGIAAVMYPGDFLDADKQVRGQEVIAGEIFWVHRRDGLGFVHMSLLNRV